MILRLLFLFLDYSDFIAVCIKMDFLQCLTSSKRNYLGKSELNIDHYMT